MYQGPLSLQAASGAGQAAMDELEQQTREVLDGKPPTQNIFPFQVGDPWDSNAHSMHALALGLH